MKRILGLRNAAAAATIACGLGWASEASATVGTVNLNIDHCTGGCLPGGGTGTVTVNDAGGILAFDVVLTGNLVFQPSTGLDAFVFSLDKTPLAVSNLTSGFSFVSLASGSIQEDGFGKFGYAIDYSGPRTVQELKFNVSAASRAARPSSAISPAQAQPTSATGSADHGSAAGAAPGGAPATPRRHRV